MHKKELTGACLALIVEVATNQETLGLFMALVYGGLGWVGAKLVEIAWNKLVTAYKNRNA